VVAGSKQTGEVTWLSSVLSRTNDLQGEIITLSLQAKGVRIVAEANRSNENAPSHRIYMDRADIGWLGAALIGGAA